jgi:hypothetical protein
MSETIENAAAEIAPEPKYSPEIIFCSLLHCRAADLLSTFGAMLGATPDRLLYLVSEAERHIKELSDGLERYRASLDTKEGGGDAD